MTSTKLTSICIVSLLTNYLTAPTPSLAHGFAGERFFPATLSTDDPFVADELSLPTISTIVTPDGRNTELSVDIAKSITPNFGLEIGEGVLKLNPTGERSVHGFDNLEVGAKYQLLTSEEHEAILSIGCDVEIGGTGGKRVGADSFSTWTPGVFFGKGLGDLPDSLSLLKPLAVTGEVGVAIPTSASTRIFSTDEETGESEVDVERNPDVFQWGFAVEYNLGYLQQNVKDIGLRAPFDGLIPLVEFALGTPLDRGQSGQTTGTINPGVIWSGKYCQFGAEAVVPVNSRTGSHVGVIAQLHFYLDDLFPRAFGHPLFGGK